ncbi:hypothetical protein D043_0205A, partial [Vibrio parahaemolyticus EKP-021]
MIILIKRVIE